LLTVRYFLKTFLWGKIIHKIVSTKAQFGGRKIQFTAYCANHRLFEINSVPYDHAGNFLDEHPLYDSPKEFPLKKNDLNETTYRLLCK
jgi:hypothetical protein